MDIERTWDNDQAIFHAFTNAKVNNNFNILYEKFNNHCSSICGCTNNPILYLMWNSLIPKDKADDPEAEYVTLYQQFIQRATIAKAANVNDVNLENYRARARKAYANTNNDKCFDLDKTEFGETRLWVHTKLSQRNRNGRQALKLIWSNQFGLYAREELNTRNHKDICALAYHGEKKRHNW